MKQRAIASKSVQQPIDGAHLALPSRGQLYCWVAVHPYPPPQTVLDSVDGKDVRNQVALTDARQRGWEYDYLLCMSYVVRRSARFARNGVNSKLVFVGDNRLVFNSRDNAIADG